MSGKWFTLGLAVALGLLAWSAWPQIKNFVSGHPSNGVTLPSHGYGRARVEFPETAVTVQIPTTQDLQEQGLAGRTSLNDQQGMLWLYGQSDYYTFWMKGMVIPIDFIWINQSQVVDITASVPPPSSPDETLLIYRPSRPADAVLEVTAGFAQRQNVKVGDRLKIDNR